MMKLLKFLETLSFQIILKNLNTKDGD